MSNITVLTLCDRIALFHSLKPFFFNYGSRRFTFTSDPLWCLASDKNDILIMVRQFIKPDYVNIDLLKKLRTKYRRIAFFHDDAGGGIPRLEILPFVDLFYSKALFKDTSLYNKSLYGKELYSDYYHKRYGIIDPDARERMGENRPEELSKLRLSWNIGIGDYPRGTLRQRSGILAARLISPQSARFFYLPTRPIQPVNKELFPIHCRIGMISRPSINYQRSLIMETVSSVPEFLTGMVPQSRFNREIKHAKITVSPFGWGELCLRDFEAVRNASLLLKPDMSHLETWPNVFIPEETYIPFNWDADNLVEIALRYLKDGDARRKIALNALHNYQGQLDQLDERFTSIIEEITG